MSLLLKTASALLAAGVLALSSCSSGSGGGSSSSAPPVQQPAPPPVDPPPASAEPERPPVPAAAPDGPSFHPEGKGWNLVWFDDFEGDTLDDTKWIAEEACWGGGNDERQCYTKREDNVEVVNGLLRLVALEEEFTGRTFSIETNPDQEGERTQPYTSGKVRTLGGRGEWTYGRISIRAKLPAGQGTWPAFWMLGATQTYGDTWPLYGEIDIMEAVNLGATCNECAGGVGENRTSSALHFGDLWPNNRFITDKTGLPGNVNPADGWHVWSVEWAEGIMHFFVDDVLHYTVRNHEWFVNSPAAAGNDNAPFDQPFYLILNLAVGGNLSEPFNDLGVDEDTYPNQLLVDWVRVYECGDDREKGLACLAE